MGHPAKTLTPESDSISWLHEMMWGMGIGRDMGTDTDYLRVRNWLDGLELDSKARDWLLGAAVRYMGV